MLVGGQRSGGTPSGENHSGGHSKGMSSWFPNTAAHGTPLPLAAETALSQYRLALGIGRLFAVTRSPRYTTKSEKFPQQSEEEFQRKKLGFCSGRRQNRMRGASKGPGFSASRTAAMTRSDPASCAGPQSVHAFSP
jgi:hypothetical protein